MAPTSSFLAFLAFVFSCVGGAVCSRNISHVAGFDENYSVTWGGNHVSYLNHGTEIQLSMDENSGAGFGSKLLYGSGFFELKIKLPGRDSAGVVTAFYLSSQGHNHDELDFEFLGNKEGKPYTVQTNVFANGVGNREQRIFLWFDPTQSFHSYKFLWNPYQIVFFVDNIPIRVFMNKTGKVVAYPTHSMRILGSLWDGEAWATDGGKTKTNWSQSPFTAHFKGFNLDACPSSHSSIITSSCSSSKLWWNTSKYRRLSSSELQAYQHVKKYYMTYDYCSDVSRFKTPPPECPQ